MPDNSAPKLAPGITAALANRVGSTYHAELCRNAVPEGITWMGALPRDTETLLPERHLGLLPAAEIADLTQRLDRVADALAQSSAATLPPAVEFNVLPLPDWPPLLDGKRIAVADDAAFCFRYPANEECLCRVGAELIFFSPLSDAVLPVCDAVWLPGGYPELHLGAIAGNRTMADSLQCHVTAGKPLLAECGGMMACFERLISVDGEAYAGFGLLPGESRMQRRLAGLGLLSAELPEGQIRGHCFHYSTSTTPLTPIAQARKLHNKGSEPVYRHGRLTASYLHAYFPSNLQASARLFCYE
jgi:cobyrinic acid a,c-diamide synthase